MHFIRRREGGKLAWQRVQLSQETTNDARSFEMRHDGYGRGALLRALLPPNLPIFSLLPSPIRTRFSHKKFAANSMGASVRENLDFRTSPTGPCCRIRPQYGT
jgi:hypothetical protein